MLGSTKKVDFRYRQMTSYFSLMIPKKVNRNTCVQDLSVFKYIDFGNCEPAFFARALSSSLSQKQTFIFMDSFE